MIYLDPHTTQRSASIDNDREIDLTYHCKSASRISITDIDSSVALVSMTI